MDEILFNASIEILKYIQSGDYDKLNDMHCLDRVSDRYIIDILTEYGGTIDNINIENYKNYFQYVQIQTQNRYMTYLDLVIDGERSDLTLVCEIELKNEKVAKMLIDHIHVL